jgi:purine-cytosine permease-like protein
VSGILTSVVFFLLLVGWFAAIWVVGYLAQERRSKNLAFILIGGELLVLLVATFNGRNHPDTLSLITSITDAVLAIWVIYLAFRLMRARGKRVVAKQGARRRRKHPTTEL